MNDESAGSTRQPRPEQVVLTVPARPEYVGVVRLAASAIAGRMAFGYDEVEDLKVAVGEAMTDAVVRSGDSVEVAFLVGSDRLEVRISSEASGGSVGDREDAEMGMLLMRVLMDEVHREEKGTRRILRLTKRLPG